MFFVIQKHVEGHWTVAQGPIQDKDLALKYASGLDQSLVVSETRVPKTLFVPHGQINEFSPGSIVRILTKDGKFDVVIINVSIYWVDVFNIDTLRQECYHTYVKAMML